MYQAFKPETFCQINFNPKGNQNGCDQYQLKSFGCSGINEQCREKTAGVHGATLHWHTN